MTTAPDTELTHPWRTSSRSTSGNECVEVAQARENCIVRDSKQPEGARLAVDRQAWSAFTRRVKDSTASI
jgi:hypothetical protein